MQPVRREQRLRGEPTRLGQGLRLCPLPGAGAALRPPLHCLHGRGCAFCCPSLHVLLLCHPSGWPCCRVRLAGRLPSTVRCGAHAMQRPDAFLLLPSLLPPPGLHCGAQAEGQFENLPRAGGPRVPAPRAALRVPGAGGCCLVQVGAGGAVGVDLALSAWLRATPPAACRGPKGVPACRAPPCGARAGLRPSSWHSSKRTAACTLPLPHVPLLGMCLPAAAGDSGPHPGEQPQLSGSLLFWPGQPTQPGLRMKRAHLASGACCRCGKLARRQPAREQQARANDRDGSRPSRRPSCRSSASRQRECTNISLRVEPILRAARPV